MIIRWVNLYQNAESIRIGSALPDLLENEVKEISSAILEGIPLDRIKTIQIVPCGILSLFH